MKLVEGIKHEGRPFLIPDCKRQTLPAFFKAMGYKVGVEIGTAHGRFMEYFCKEGLVMYGVDPWFGFKGQGRLTEGEDVQNEYFEETKARLKGYANCTLIRKTSMEAVREFEDASLDFVYIDGNHDFSYITEDIREWEKKVRPGGVVSGHDYWDSTYSLRKRVVCHVKPAVDIYVKTFGIKNFYIFGAVKDFSQHLSEETYNSWMWIKQ